MSQERLLDNPDEIREKVREGYTRIVERQPAPGAGASSPVDEMARRIGYSDEQIEAAPTEANLGVGCGNPTALAELRPGQVVLDLGSGAGFDAFLAARAVGPTGHAIGVDMTDAMLEKARENARRAGIGNVEFRKGTIEDLPLADESVDVIISNCVINLSPEKDRVFREAFRVLRPGGRLMISDLVLERPLPDEVLASVDAYLGCIGGASQRGIYLETIAKAGFRNVQVLREARVADAFDLDHPQLIEGAGQLGMEPREAHELLQAVTSLHVRALK